MLLLLQDKRILQLTEEGLYRRGGAVSEVVEEMSFQPSREDGGCLRCPPSLGEVSPSVGGRWVGVYCLCREMMLLHIYFTLELI